MNEQFAKLASQAGFDVGIHDGMILGNFSDMHKCQKFAELIVKEIADFVDSHEQVDKYGEAYEIVYGSDIRRLFGVK